jgi:O-antigen ligase
MVPLGLSVLMTLCLSCAYQSRTPILIALLALVTAVSFSRRRLLYVFALSALLLVVIVDGLLGFPFTRKFALGFNGRIPLWLTAFSMFADAPILGHGPHTFGLFYLDYLHRLEIPAWLSVDVRPLGWVHNVYLQVLAEQGIVGALALLALITCAVRLAWRTHRHAEGETRILNAGAFSALIALCMTAMFDASLMREWFVTALFVILGIVSHLSTLASVERRKIE